ncbi:GNAT family N-acetyltransferase [Pedobacter sp.]
MEISKLTSVTDGESEQICELALQLGYINNLNSLKQRLANIIALNDHAIFVAKADGEIVGWLHCLVCLRVESPIFVEITGLVVHENSRGKQLGRHLIEASKKWSISKQIDQIKLRCNVIRKESHQFYLSLGFSLSKEQKVFEILI